MAVIFGKNVQLKLLSEAKFSPGRLFNIYLPLTLIIFILNYFILIPLGELFFNDELLISLIQEYYKEYSLTSQTFTSQVLLFVSFVIITPICEEIYFRKYCYNYLRENFTLKLSILVTFLVFFLFHPLPSLVFSTLLFTAFVCIVYERTRDIKYPILIHALNNSLGLIVKTFS